MFPSFLGSLYSSWSSSRRCWDLPLASFKLLDWIGPLRTSQRIASCCLPSVPPQHVDAFSLAWGISSGPHEVPSHVACETKFHIELSAVVFYFISEVACHATRLRVSADTSLPLIILHRVLGDRYPSNLIGFSQSTTGCHRVLVPINPFAALGHRANWGAEQAEWSSLRVSPQRRTGESLLSHIYELPRRAARRRQSHMVCLLHSTKLWRDYTLSHGS